MALVLRSVALIHTQDRPRLSAQTMVVGRNGSYEALSIATSLAIWDGLRDRRNGVSAVNFPTILADFSPKEIDIG